MWDFQGLEPEGTVANLPEFSSEVATGVREGHEVLGPFVVSMILPINSYALLRHVLVVREIFHGHHQNSGIPLPPQRRHLRVRVADHPTP